MRDEQPVNLYESGKMAEITGETLRPGGFSLTDIGVQYCLLSPGDTVLDLGCGLGATVNYLYHKYNISAFGIDPSEKMIAAAKHKYEYADFFLGYGEQLPFDNGSFDGVFAECTLSLMENLDSVIQQVFRVLKENGWFIISDIYARNPKAAAELHKYPADNCIRGMHHLKQLRGSLVRAGFSVVHTADFSQYLKELIVNITFSSDTPCEFWNTADGSCTGGDDYYQAIKRCKPGYFLMIAKKKGDAYGR
jgi:arsenite methyltransferase